MIARSTRIDHAPHYESPPPARCGDAPQGRARPVAGNQREMAANGGANTHHPAQRPRDKAQLTPKPTLVPPPATPQTARKGRLNFLYSVQSALVRIGPMSNPGEAAMADTGTPAEAAAQVAAPPKPKPQPAKAKVHTVKRGETLTSISRKFGCDLADLAKANKLKAPKYAIRPGQPLKLDGCKD